MKEEVVEGKTPEITVAQAQRLLRSIQTTYRVQEAEVVNVVGLRDRAVLATLAYTACRAGAVARLRLQDFQYDGEQYVLRFQEKGGKAREIPVRLDLQRVLLAYLDAAGLRAEPKDSPLFRSTRRKTRRLTANPLTSKAICERVKRRLKDARLPTRLSPHSFRVTAITDLLTQGVPLRDLGKSYAYLSPELAQVVRHVKEQGASAIGIDLMVPDSMSTLADIARSGAPGDARPLGKAIRQAGNVVLPEWRSSCCTCRRTPRTST